jgi:hypothetical protein
LNNAQHYATLKMHFQCFIGKFWRLKHTVECFGSAVECLLKIPQCCDYAADCFEHMMSFKSAFECHTADLDVFIFFAISLNVMM